MKEFDLSLIKMDKPRVIYAYLILDGFFQIDKNNFFLIHIYLSCSRNNRSVNTKIIN